MTRVALSYAKERCCLLHLGFFGWLNLFVHGCKFEKVCFKLAERSRPEQSIQPLVKRLLLNIFVRSAGAAGGGELLNCFFDGNAIFSEGKGKQGLVQADFFHLHQLKQN